MEKAPDISEAPTIKTPIENSTTIEYEIDKETKLKAIFNDKIISFNVSQFSLLQKDYELIISLEQLYKINKFFINFENTNDLINWIINSLKQKNSFIKLIDNKCIIQLINPITNKKFELNLNSKEKDLNTRVNDLEAFIIEQKKNINLEERIKKLEAIIAEKNEEKNRIMFDSEIVDKKEQYMIIEWLPRKLKK